MKRWRIAPGVVAGLFFGGCLGGCQIDTSTKGRSEYGFRFGSEVSFYSQSSATAPEPSENKLKVTVDDRIMGPPAPEPEPPNP